MKSVLLFALLFGVALSHPQKWLCGRGVPSPYTHSRYYLSDIATENGVAQFNSPETGKTYYWNLCSTPGNLTEICGDGNAVCFTEASKTYAVGRYDNVSVSVLEDDAGVLVSFAGGEICSESDDTTTSYLIYVCQDNATTPIISVSEEACNVNITIFSQLACPSYDNDDFTYETPRWNKRQLIRIALWTFVAFFSMGILCTFCVCCKIRRDRCRRNRIGGHQYTELSTQADNSAPIQTQQVPAAPQYFMTVNGVNYPVNMVPQPAYYMPQPVQKAPAPATLVPLEETDAKSSQIEEDEKLARALQAQLNQ